MGELGATTLWMAICLATYSGVGSIVGKIFGIYSLLESTKKSVYLLVLVLGVCTASLVVCSLAEIFPSHMLRDIATLLWTIFIPGLHFTLVMKGRCYILPLCYL